MGIEVDHRYGDAGYSRISRRPTPESDCPRDETPPWLVPFAQIGFVPADSIDVQTVDTPDKAAQTKMLAPSGLADVTSSLGSWSLSAKPYKTSYLRVTIMAKSALKRKGYLPSSLPLNLHSPH